jgi:hypothetical protein
MKRKFTAKGTKQTYVAGPMKHAEKILIKKNDLRK